MGSPLIVKLTQANFAAEVQSGTPVLVDFWAEWCGPCKMLLPVIEQFSKDIGDKAIIAKVNVDECPDVAEMFDVQSIPTLMIFKNSEMKERTAGFKPAPVLKQLIEKHM